MFFERSNRELRIYLYIFYHIQYYFQKVHSQLQHQIIHLLLLNFHNLLFLFLHLDIVFQQFYHLYYLTLHHIIQIFQIHQVISQRNYQQHNLALKYFLFQNQIVLKFYICHLLQHLEYKKMIMLNVQLLYILHHLIVVLVFLFHFSNYLFFHQKHQQFHPNLQNEIKYPVLLLLHFYLHFLIALKVLLLLHYLQILIQHQNLYQLYHH